MAADPVLTPQEIERAALVRAAAELIGYRALATKLDIAERTIYAMAAGKRRCRESLLADVRTELIAHRQRVGALVRIIADHLGTEA